MDWPASAADIKPLHQGVSLWIAWATTALLAIAGGFGWWGWLHSRQAHPYTVTRSAMITVNYTRSPALSSDGTRLAYFEVFEPPRLLLRMMDQLEGRAIPGAEDAMNSPAFSPDGKWIAYVTGRGELRKIPVNGGTPIHLGDLAEPGFGAS